MRRLAAASAAAGITEIAFEQQVTVAVEDSHQTGRTQLSSPFARRTRSTRLHRGNLCSGYTISADASMEIGSRAANGLNEMVEAPRPGSF